MKTIITILFLTSLSLLANERGADRREMKAYVPSHSEEIKALENAKRDEAKDNATHYLPAITEELSRDLMITSYRNERNKSYKGDARFRSGIMAKSLGKQSSDSEKSIAENEEEIWTEAIAGNEHLSSLRKGAIRHTYAWYKIQEIKKSSNLEKKEKLEELSNLLK